MDEYKATINKYLDEADAKLLKYPYVGIVAEKTKVRPAYIASGVSILFSAFLFYRVGAKPVTNVIGFVYPLLMSFQALRTPNHEDDCQWLTYWIVYGFFSLLESFTDMMLYWIPMYHLWKIALLVWCFLPSTRGAQYMFDHFISPFLKKHEHHIDGARTFTGREVNQASEELKGDLANVAKEVSGSVRRKIVEAAIDNASHSSGHHAEGENHEAPGGPK